MGEKFANNYIALLSVCHHKGVSVVHGKRVAHFPMQRSILTGGMTKGVHMLCMWTNSMRST